MVDLLLPRLITRLRRGRVTHSQFHGVGDGFSSPDDAVAVVLGACQKVMTMIFFAIVPVTAAMPLPDTSGERE